MSVFVNDGGIEKEAKMIYVNDGGVDKLVAGGASANLILKVYERTATATIAPLPPFEDGDLFLLFRESGTAPNSGAWTQILDRVSYAISDPGPNIDFTALGYGINHLVVFNGASGIGETSAMTLSTATGVVRAGNLASRTPGSAVVVFANRIFSEPFLSLMRPGDNRVYVDLGRYLEGPDFTQTVSITLPTNNPTGSFSRTVEVLPK